VGEIGAEDGFAIRHRAEDEIRRVPVEIEVQEAASCRDVLLGDIAQEVRLAGAGLPEDREMLRALRLLDRYATGAAVICDSYAEVKRAGVDRFTRPRRPPIPEPDDEFLYEPPHISNS